MFPRNFMNKSPSRLLSDLSVCMFKVCFTSKKRPNIYETTWQHAPKNLSTMSPNSSPNLPLNVPPNIAQMSPTHPKGLAQSFQACSKHMFLQNEVRFLNGFEGPGGLHPALIAWQSSVMVPSYDQNTCLIRTRLKF